MATIAVLGTLDTKGPEHACVADLIRARGHQTLLIDTGTGAPPTVTPDLTRDQVAAAAGLDLPALIARRDRGEAVAAMSGAAAQLLGRDLWGLVRFHMRPKLQAVQGGVRRHPVQIEGEPIQINDRYRCLELFEIRCHRALLPVRQKNARC
jgi:hypothetical protein